MDLSGAALLDTDVGGATANTSGGFCFVANIKKDNNKKATSHIAVMSMMVLFLGILTFGIFICFQLFFKIQNDDQSIQLFIQRCKSLC